MNTEMTQLIHPEPGNPIPYPFVSQEFIPSVLHPQKKELLSAWAVWYFKTQVMGAPLKTQQAKQRDLDKFLRFFAANVGHDQVDSWTPAVTKQFQQTLGKTLSPVTE